MSESLDIEVSLSDSRAIDIVEGLSEDEFDEMIEKYIILGDMVLSYASVVESEETVEKFLEGPREKLETAAEQLSEVVPTISKPAEKGKMSEKDVYNDLNEHFMDDDFENVAGKDSYTDLKAKPSGINRNILIEIKDYSNNVPGKEVDKFWNDLEERDIEHGIFVSLRSDIANIPNSIEFKERMDKIGVFVKNKDLGMDGHRFVYYVVKKMLAHEMMEKEELDQEEVEELVTNLNKCLGDIRTYAEQMEEIRDKADSIQTRTNNRLKEIKSIANDCKKKIDEEIERALKKVQEKEI